MSSSPSCITSSSSATMQGAKLFSMFSLSVAFSHVAGTVAGSRTLTDVSGSGSASLLRKTHQLVGRGGLRLSVSGGLGHVLHAAGRCWAGRWVWSGLISNRNQDYFAYPIGRLFCLFQAKTHLIVTCFFSENETIIFSYLEIPS